MDMLQKGDLLKINYILNNQKSIYNANKQKVYFMPSNKFNNFMLE